MKPGGELDAIVADKIFGLTMRDRHTGKEVPITLDQLLMSGSALRIMTLPRYSTDIAAAWTIISKLDGQWTLDGQDGIGWDVSYVEASMREDRYEKPFRSNAGTAPNAVCLAALKAVGVDLTSLG